MGRWIPDPTPAGGPLPKSNHGRKPPKPPKNTSRKPPAPKAHRSSGSSNTGRGAPPTPPKGGGKPDACCPMVAAYGAARRGKYRLARRYAAWSLRLIAGRLAWAA